MTRPHLGIAAISLSTNQGFKNLICSIALNNRFLFHILRACIEDLDALGRGNTFKEIPAKVVKEFRIHYHRSKCKQPLALF